MKKLLALLLLLVSIVVFLSFKLINTNSQSGEVDNLPQVETEVNVLPEKEEIPEVEEIMPKEPIKEELLNILLIGVDGEGYGKDKRSDVMIVATLDVNNKALKLTSVARDTLAYLPKSETYEKINHSYAKGGPQNTLATINTNLDLDIKDYVVFDYKALIKAVDLVGGLPVNVTKDEAKDFRIHGDKINIGEQVLSGNEAITYMRMRKNSGGDTGRNQRQRDLIIHIMKKAQNMNKIELLEFSTSMLSAAKTSYNLLDIKELLDIYVKIRSGLVMEQHSYPFDYEGGILSDKLWYATPTNVESNVIKFHEEILAEEDYSPNVNILRISNGVINKSGIDKE